MRNSTESRTYQAYHPGLVETSNGFRSELPTNSGDPCHWGCNPRISSLEARTFSFNSRISNLEARPPMHELFKKHVHFEDSNSLPKSSNFFVDLFKSFKNGESSVEGGGWTNGGDLRRYYTSEQRTTTIVYKKYYK